MPKCNKIKNPCKICLGPVSQKNGLQCQGACQSWVHYNCLNYTPGKIKDIKAGVIKITCPCPDCKITLPREYRIDEPFSCTNTQCPANNPPKCGNMLCPINKGHAKEQVPVSTGCALDKCGKSCKTNSYPNIPDAPQPLPIQPCVPPNHPFPGSASASSDTCLVAKGCPAGCSSDDIPGDIGRKGSPIVPSLGTLEQMCNTVGQLTNQINNLMAKMQQVVREKNGTGQKGCSQKGPKSMCKKPCYCPGNPGRRM